MIPDIRQMGIAELERLLISNAGRARDIGKGNITFSDITVAIGISHDDGQVKALHDKMAMAKCVTKRGKYYTFTVEKISEPDDSAIKNDPTLSLMDKIFDAVVKPSPERDIIIHLTDDNKRYPCRNCYMLDAKHKICGSTGKPAKEDDIPDDCDEFKLDIATLGYNKKSWYRKKKGTSARL
jgi:hypothetical protein